MAGSKPSVSASHNPPRQRRSTAVAAFVIGIPLAVGVLYLINFTSPDSIARRYVEHLVEKVEVVMFCCALGALGAKFWRYRTERAACRTEVLPPWDGKQVSVTEAGKLLSSMAALPWRLQRTYLMNRVAAVLDFLCSRNSADDLDDQLRTLTDNDAVALEGSYALTRFITWAIPILGFLGTVLGITRAISGVTPEVLEKSLSTVTDGLAEAFDTTALGLALTMITMFLSFLIERAEQSVLETVDQYVDRQLAHRFERMGTEGGEFVGVLRHNTQILLTATEQVVQRQAELWAKTIEQTDRKRLEAEDRQQQRLSGTLEKALERTLETHARLLTGLEKQTVDQSAGILKQIAALASAVRETGREQGNAMAQVAHDMKAKTEALARLQEGETQLLRLQDALNQNLTALAGANAFEEAVHSLTAAIHLLTVKSAEHRVPGADIKPATRKGPGAAA